MGKSKRSEIADASQPPGEDRDATQAAGGGETALPFPVVGIGASAGGLAAIEAFFASVPAQSGCAFVVVTHLAPDNDSHIPDILSRITSIPIAPISAGQHLQPDHIYTMVPSQLLSISGGMFGFTPMLEPRIQHKPIDYFFEALARSPGPRSVAIVLSGSGDDGTAGIDAVKAAGGMVMVQDPSTADFRSMPDSAIATGLADYVLPPASMSKQLSRYSVATPPSKTNLLIDGSASGAMQQIIILLRTRTGHDFSGYKLNTICRRIERRMTVHQISEPSDYFRLLRESDTEDAVLFRELLIGVTSFFRDPEVYERLKTVELPGLLESKPLDEHVRVWVAGCATGQEAYSLAIVLHECMEELGQSFHIQIFATDIDEDAVNFARRGLYSADIAGQVSPARLRRYFDTCPDGSFRVKKMIREMVVFAPQNVTKDPPFTNLDLLSCRNLLIYFQTDLQRKLLPFFHYSLRPNGILSLGASETIGTHTELFSVTDKKWKLYSKNASATAPVTLRLPTTPPRYAEKQLDSSDMTKIDDGRAIQFMEAILNRSTSPPCAIIDESNNVIYIHGRTGNFLEPAEGRLNANILNMARADLKPVMSDAIRKVLASRVETRRENLEIGSGSQTIHLNLTVAPLMINGPGAEMLLMILFQQITETEAGDESQPSESRTTGKTAEELEWALHKAEANLQAVAEEMQAANEELKSTNEELQSTNEELQSTNEELETSKEELQSLHEESVTVNSELQAHIDELSKTNDDMKNLLDSTDIATVFLDVDLCIRSFTQRSVDIIPLAATDKGRPISDLATNLASHLDLKKFAALVLDDLSVREIEVRSSQDSVYLLRARPYRTVANMIDGVVLTFENVTRLKHAEKQLAQACSQESAAQFLALLQNCQDGFFLVNSQGLVTGVNPSICELLAYPEAELLNRSLNTLIASDAGDPEATELEAPTDLDASHPRTTVQQTFVRKDGTTVRASTTITWHRDAAEREGPTALIFVGPTTDA